MALKSYSGVGCVYMATVDANGSKTGNWLKVGNAYPLAVQVETSQVEVKSRMCDTAGQTLAVKTEITGSKGSLTLREWNAANLAMALSGEAVKRTGAGGSVSSENFTAVTAGEFGELDHRDISNLVVKDSTDATTYVEGTDYLVNKKLGLLAIIDGGAISVGDTLHVSYDYAAESGYRVDIGTKAIKRAAIMANLRNEFSGEEFTLELDSAVFAANKEINFISEPGSEGEELAFDLTLETVGTATSPGRVNGISM